jgi:multidrug resistance efflux pump
MRRLAVIAIVVIAAIGGVWLLLGRPGGGPAATPDPSLAPVPPSTEVVADGRVVPARYAELGAAVPGTIVEVLAAEGDAVAAGAALVRLDGAAAQAEVDAASAAVAAAEAAVAGAEAGVTQAAAAVDAAEAAVDQAVAGVDRARAARDGLPSSATDAQEAAADAEIDAARATLAGAQANLRAARAGATAAAAAETAARADADRARAGQAAAEAALDQLTIAAPFAGTVASLDARVGERAAPGVPLVRIADTSGWRIETSDLDETTVARVAVGAPATINFDGLPDARVDGTVTSVALFGTSAQGDVVYRAIVTPSSVPDGIRWNMTATVTVDAAE